MEDGRKLLVYGGAFDPPHLGHLRYFKNALEAIKPHLSLVVPSGVSPHKRHSSTPYAHRYTMCGIFRLPGWKVRVSRVEYSKNRRRSYTIKTIRRLRRHYPGWHIYFMVGSDMLLSFRRWYRWRRILALCTLVVGIREDQHYQRSVQEAQRLRELGAEVIMVPFRPLEVSSTEIRLRLEQDQGCGDLLAPETEEYIKRHGLYLED